MRTKRIFAILSVLLLATVLCGACTKTTKWDGPCAVVWGDRLYYCRFDGEISAGGITEEMVTGRISSVCDLSELPDKYGEANFPAAENMEIAVFQGKLYLHGTEGSWYRLYLQEEIK